MKCTWAKTKHVCMGSYGLEVDYHAAFFDKDGCILNTNKGNKADIYIWERKQAVAIRRRRWE